MSVAPLSDLRRNESEARWTEGLEASAAAQGPRPISHGGKSASSHPNVCVGPEAQIQRRPSHQRATASWVVEQTSHTVQIQ